MANDDHKQRMAQLEARIAAAKQASAPQPKGSDHHTQAQLAWRMVIELVAGLGIGFGIGYGLDSLFGTLPIFLVLFTLLGLAAGIKVMLASAREIQTDRLADDTAAAQTQGPAGDDGDEQGTRTHGN
ncbi:MAG: AtpZ/AtpI family protein [Pseudomonadota bacterium]|nr:AtpZ/AtpI family protein [Pseudomonadota bacterium]